jgi:Spy/CpxP family protein refolding chaperone
MQAAQSRLREAFDAQRRAVEAVPFDEGQIQSTSQGIAAAQTEVALVQARVRNEVWNLLTAEQQTRARQLTEERAARQKEREARAGGRPGRL